MARRLLHGKVSAETEELVAAAVSARWASSGDLADALEQLAIEAFTVSAQRRHQLDDLEDDLFRFGRLVSGQPALRSALIGPAPGSAKRDLLANLLADKVSSPSMSLITQLLTHTARPFPAGGARPGRRHSGPAARTAHRGGACRHRADSRHSGAGSLRRSPRPTAREFT